MFYRKMLGHCIYMWLIVIYTHLPGPGAVYFTQRLFRGNVQPSDEAGQGIVKLYSALNSTDTKGSLIDYEIAAILGGEDGVNYNMAFSVNRSGWINLEDPDVFIKSQGNQVTLHVEARAGVETPSTSVEVQVTFNDPADIPCADACFWESISSLYAEENSEAMVLGRLGINLRHMACQHVDLTYQITNFHVPSLQVPNLDPKDWLYLNNRSSEIALVTSLDREAWEIANISVTCLVKYRNGSAERRQQSLDLTVSDVDDSPPVLRNHRSTIQLDRKQWNLVKRNKSLSLVVADNDTAGSYDYEVFLRKNEHGWFSVLKPKIFQLKSSGRWKSTALRAEILMVADEKPPGVISSNFEVVFLDKLYQKARHSPLRGEVVVEVEVKLTEQKTADRVVHDQYTANISQQAAKFSEVLNLAKEMGYTQASGLLFYMRNSTGMFKVTLKTGIIYVNDPDILLATPHVINVTIQFRSATGQKTILVAVNVIPNHFKQRLQCNGTCSSHRTETECETSCGLGAVRGRCVMRRETRLDRHTKDYGTCSPNLITCPDSVCDELEEENELLCPQDCTQDHVKGAVLRSGNEDSRGIQRAAGTCYCNIMASCQCWANKTFYQATEDRMSGVDTLPSAHLEETHPTVPGPLTSGTSGVTEASGVTKEDMDDDSLCDTTCKTIIGLVIVTVVVVLLIFFLVWCIQKRRKRRTDKLRHVGSNVSMNAIPSDYVEERRTSHNSIEWSPKIINTQNGYDKKWEFPRKNLILGKNLGEGEFGQVVQAKAYHISPCEEYSPVAVKMLKNCSNETEYQDLLSEFNLLKDVSHPNVIKLLGACTKEEPLYIIVEYCEYGSLRHYLRSCRHNNALSMEGQDISSGQSKSLTKYSLSTRELLSFAWQIAKGMHYLAEMKVVHRDLAARNVLVASGKVVKISDFGLSRDVYEADAYMKKSKGRIPVKWMAPESLYDQVYTIKSDVWSYGIVLWEIVTLGATPYPGIPPERLFGLLKSGYRMDRPENCSDELYAVMQKCWKAEPQRRPYFIDLVNIFDSMLQAKMEYLDLNGAFRAPFEQDNDLSLDGLTSGSPARHCCLLGMDQTYGNINFKTDSSSYLTPTFKTEQLINRENNSRGKTFPKNECLQAGQIHRQFHGRVKLDYEVDMEDDVFEAQETDSLRCTKGNNGQFSLDPSRPSLRGKSYPFTTDNFDQKDS